MTTRYQLAEVPADILAHIQAGGDKPAPPDDGSGQLVVDNLNAALRYGRLGWEIFPLAPGRKTPAIPTGHGGHGFYDATSIVEQIAKWWLYNPRYGIGLRPPVGVVVVDVDPKNGGGRTLISLLAANGPLPATLTQDTASGGQHYLLLCPGPFKKCLGVGIDLKCHDTGYVVVDPTVLADTAEKRYQPYLWRDSDVEVAEAPEWLKPMMRAPAPPFRRLYAEPRTPRAQAEQLRRWVQYVEDGETPGAYGTGRRNTHLWTVIGWAIEAGYADGDHLTGDLENQLSAPSTLDDREIERCFKSAFKKAGITRG